MEQRDYLKKQIDQAGKVLEKMLADLLGFKSQAQLTERVEATRKALHDQLDIDTEALMNIPSVDLLQILEIEKKLSKENMGKLADIWLLMADREQMKSKLQATIYEKCLTIYEYLEKVENSASFDRHLKIIRIKNALTIPPAL